MRGSATLIRLCISLQVHMYVCMYNICMYVSVMLKNARMSHLGMQFYTTTKGVPGETEISREC